MLSLLFLLLLRQPPAAAAPLPSLTVTSTCPYDLGTASLLIPSECYANATAAQAATGCCWYVFVAYIFAASAYANLTGAAFLPAGPAAACSAAFAATVLSGGLVAPSLLYNNGSCDLTGHPGKLAAGSRPCQLPTVAGLLAFAPNALPNATRLCAASGSNATDLDPNLPACITCRNAVIAATYEMLNTSHSKEFVPCGMAATIGIWSQSKPSLPRFRSYALCMLQILENVNSLGTGDLVPSPPPSSVIVVTPASDASNNSSSPRTIPIAAGSAAAGVVAVIGIVFIAVAIKKVRRRRRLFSTAGDGGDGEESVASLPPLPREGLYIFTKAELKQATNSYDERLLLGEGGAGKVYLGRLPSGQHVAIKRFYREKKVAEFYGEVAVLAKLRHRNLATLVGYCVSDGGYHALVYEYMPGGNLSHALFHGDLTWRRRLQVAVDVAEGLVYLHEFREGPVVHRDVKPTNVLLADSGTAKLSDFGVSRIVPAGGTHVSTEVRGTMGYVDPESFSAGHISEAADVYSFGVVLLELVTGMRAVVPTPSGGAESIVHAAHWAVRDKGGEAAAAGSIVDPRLRPAWDRPAVGAVFATACRCVRPYKHERPTMAEVLAELKAVLADYEARESSGLADAERLEATPSSSAVNTDVASAPSSWSPTATTELASVLST